MGGLHEVIDELLLVEVRDLPDDSLAERIVEVDRAINRLNAAKLSAVEVIDRRGAVAAEAGSTAAWLRGKLHCSPAVATRTVHLARDLADTLPVLAERLAEGRVSVDHAQVAAGLRKTLSDEVVRQVDASLADAAQVCTVSEFRGFVTELRHSLDPEVLVADERSLWDQRALHVATTFGGAGVGSWTVDPVSHEIVTTAIHAASAPVAGDDRSPANRRADGLITIAQFFLDHHGAPQEHKIAPHITITATIETLTGQPGAPPARTAYGQLISRDALLRLCCDAAIARVVFGPDNAVINAGRANRTYTTAARRAVVARDQHCRWPGCTTPPGWCEIHHPIHWANDGPSDTDNAILLCGRHHDRIHHRRHQVVISPRGTYTVDAKPDSGHYGSVRDERPGLWADGPPPTPDALVPPNRAGP